MFLWIDLSGLAYMKQCDIEKYIPIYLIVAGGVGLFKAIIQAGLLVVRSESVTHVDGRQFHNLHYNTS